MQEYSACAPDRPAISRRLAALGPVLLLHAGLLAAFLYVSWSSLRESNLAGHEIILLLKPEPPVPKWRGDLLPSFDKAAIAMPRYILPPVRDYVIAPTDPQALALELQGVSRELFKCWPGNIAALGRSPGPQCLTLAPGRLTDLFEPPERSANAARWLRDRDRKNAPLRLPCTYGMSASSVLCVADGVINGFDLENAPGYAEDDDAWHMSGADRTRREMQTIDPCALDKTLGFGFVCLDRVVNGNAPP
jgi:hypothetical protein